MATACDIGISTGVLAGIESYTRTRTRNIYPLQRLIGVLQNVWDADDA